MPCLPRSTAPPGDSARSLWSGGCARCYLQEALWHGGISQPESVSIPESGSLHTHPPQGPETSSVIVLLIWGRAASSLPVTNNPGYFSVSIYSVTGLIALLISLDFNLTTFL